MSRTFMPAPLSLIILLMYCFTPRTTSISTSSSVVQGWPSEQELTFDPRVGHMIFKARAESACWAGHSLKRMTKEGSTDSRLGERWNREEYSPLLTCQTGLTGDVTPDAILNFTGLGPFQFLAFLLSGLTYLASGCDSGIFVYLKDSVAWEWNLTTSEYAILPALTSPPNVAGALIFSFTSDRFGRWWPYALCMSWVGVFSAVSAFSSSFPLLIFLRCTASFAIGGIPCLAYPTVIEFLPVKSRGSVVVLNTLMEATGSCLACGLAWWLIPTYPIYGWRYYIVACATPALVVAIFRLVFYVESPRYFTARGKFEQAWRVFSIIAVINRKRLSEFVSYDQFCIFSCRANRWHQLKVRPSIFRQVLKIFYPQYLQWTLPISLIVVTESFGLLGSSLFLPDFLKRVGVSRYFTLMVIHLARIPGNLLLSIIVEWPKVGRLNSLRFFTVLAVVFFLLLSLIQTPLFISLFLMIIYFSIAPIRSLMYTYISEVYPTSIRSVSVSYFYILETMTSMVGVFAGGKAANVEQHWIFPAVFTCVYFTQLCLSFSLHYESGGKGLKDSIPT